MVHFSRRGRSGRVSIQLATLALALGLVLIRGSARACGGLFCSAAAPVVQDAERILFGFDAEREEVTAVIEIRYSGPSERFAWLLPVPGVPEVGVSNTQILDQLQARTAPGFRVTFRPREICSYDPFPTDDRGSLSPTAATVEVVRVVGAGSVGPYDYETLSVAASAAEPAQAAIDWLQDNDYELGPIGAEVLRPYLAEGMNLLALRLSKNTSVGSIRPLWLRYSSAAPTIPIRPTAVAASDDMNVLVWVASHGRAVPANYDLVELNKALVNPFNPDPSYGALLQRAVLEGRDGRAFVTEYALPLPGQVDNLGGVILDDFTHFREEASALSDTDLVLRSLQFPIPSIDYQNPFARPPPEGLADVLTAQVTGDADQTQRLIDKPWCFVPAEDWNRILSRCDDECTVRAAGECSEADAGNLPGNGFDRRRFVDQLEEFVLKPLEVTLELLQRHRYLTRMSTRLSPRQMTLDPAFVILPNQRDVPPLHTIEAEFPTTCIGPEEWSTTTLGFQLESADGSWPIQEDLETTSIPLNDRILRYDGNGRLVVVEDRRHAIEFLLDNEYGTRGGCGLAVPSYSGSPNLAWLGLLGWVALRRRRRCGVKLSAGSGLRRAASSGRSRFGTQTPGEKRLPQ